MKKIILGLLLTTAITTTAHAATPTTTAPATATAPAVTTPAYTPKAGKGAEFESLSKAEKIKLIEQKHAEAKASYDAKWKAMSDDDKIAKYEQRRQRFMARKNGAATPNAAQATQVTAPVPTK